MTISDNDSLSQHFRMREKGYTASELVKRIYLKHSAITTGRKGFEHEKEQKNTLQISQKILITISLNAMDGFSQ